MVILLIAISAVLLAALAEALHARRISRIARLAFVPTGRPAAWTRAVPVVRPLALGLCVWGLLTLLSIDGTPARTDPGKSTADRHLLIALDASPSMFIRDAGPQGKQLRRERAAEVLRSVFQRLDMARTRVSIVAFYTTAKTVVVDTSDLNVVHNILADLPLEYAFKEGQTNMYAGVREAVALAGKWPPNSATLIVVSDGDTLPDAIPPRLPASITDALILGVGNPYRGTSIAGHSSRQDISSLRGLAARLRGVYHDGNTKHLPTTVLAGLSMLRNPDGDGPSTKTLALIAAGAGAATLASIAPLLAAFGAPRRVPRDRAPRHSVAGSSESLSSHTSPNPAAERRTTHSNPAIPAGATP
ncbi:MAG TPA: vWA domain-containing protein [Phycisphaerales bacterium]|nr:vWA domain-containing protein [Phycisphaerales bacterium]